MKKRLLALILSCCMVPLAFKSDYIDNAKAASRQLNIITTFDISEIATYSAPNAFNARFDEMTTKVADAYQNNFSITLNFTKPTSNYVISSCAYECRSGPGKGNYDSFCMHVSDQYCSNSGPYHCTNSGTIKEDVLSKTDITSQGYQMHVTAVRVCNVANRLHGSINGMWYSDGFIVIRDTDYTKETDVLNPSFCDVIYYAKTVAHEVGHAYGVQDHYSSETDGTANCIWGYNKEDEAVANSLLMCSACRVTIMQNGNNFNHS